MKPRVGLLHFHRWLGVLLAPFVFYMVITGLALLWREQLDPLINPELHIRSVCQRPLSLDRAVEIARIAHSSSPVAQVELRRSSGEPVMVRFRDTVGIYLDRCSGLVLGQRSRWGGVLGSIESLHRFRFLGLTGLSEAVVGTISMALIVGILAGALLWLRRYRTRLAWSLSLWRQPSRVARELVWHRLAGLCAAPIALLALTGSLVLAFDWARNVVYLLTLSEAPRPRPSLPAADVSSIPLDRLFGWVVALVPDADRVVLVLPKSATAPAEAQVVGRDEFHANARTTIYFDTMADRVLRVEPYAGSSLGHKTYRWLVSLHTGEVGGWVGKLLQATAMLMLLVATGIGVQRLLRRGRQQRMAAHDASHWPAGLPSVQRERPPLG